MIASLSGLTIGALTLAPTFNPKTTEYTASTENATNAITATAEEGATISITVNGNAHTNGQPATWQAGANTVQILASEEGKTSTLYTVTVTKATYATVDCVDLTGTTFGKDDVVVNSADFTSQGAGSYTATASTAIGTSKNQIAVMMATEGHQVAAAGSTLNGEPISFAPGESERTFTASGSFIVGENTLVFVTTGLETGAAPATYTITITNTAE